MANASMCHLEETLSRDGLMPDLYKRYVDDTLAKMRGTETASAFLTTPNGPHSNMEFTMALSDKILLKLKLSRVRLNYKLNFTGNQQTLAYSYISTATLINATVTLY